MSAHLVPRTVTVAYRGGPRDGALEPLTRGDHPLPERLHEHYRLGGATAVNEQVTALYEWTPPRTGRRQPCEVGGDRGCPGSRCPSHRQRQTT